VSTRLRPAPHGRVGVNQMAEVVQAFGQEEPHPSSVDGIIRALAVGLRSMNVMSRSNGSSWLLAAPGNRSAVVTLTGCSSLDRVVLTLRQPVSGLREAQISAAGIPTVRAEGDTEGRQFGYRPQGRFHTRRDGFASWTRTTLPLGSVPGA
jgi:hypothetical protein